MWSDLIVTDLMERDLPIPLHQFLPAEDRISPARPRSPVCAAPLTIFIQPTFTESP
jgi:hypothetical protein